MIQRVELGADLAKFSGDDFFVAALLIAGSRWRGALELHAEAALAKKWDRGAELFAQFKHFALANQFGGPQHRFRSDQIGRAALIISTPLRRAALLRCRWHPGLRRRCPADGD